MRIPSPHSHHVIHAMKAAGENDGLSGAIAGTFATAGTVALAAASAGLMLTPLGWVVVGTAGAVLGGTGVFKKLRQKFSS